MKIVINDRFGGFSLSHAGVMRYAELKGITLYPYVDDITKKVYGEKPFPEYPWLHYSTLPAQNEDDLNRNYFTDTDIPRDDPALIKLVEEMGERANGDCAHLKVIEIPDGIDFEIEEYDGNEWVAEKHRTWR